MSKFGPVSTIAAALGVSRQQANVLARRGMPTDDLDAARLWRHRHLDRAKMKPDPGPSAATLIARVHALRDLADHARAAGALDVMLSSIRAALAAVPAEHRVGIELQTWLWQALIGPHAMGVLAAGPSVGGVSDEGAATAGAIVGALAAGELVAR